MNHRRARLLGGMGLIAAAVLVWCRDTTWLGQAADTLPLAAGLPLAWWFGGPWKPRDGAAIRSHPPAFIVAALVFACGWIISSLTLLSLAWTALAWFWTRTLYQAKQGRRRLLLVSVLSFPWLVLEWPQLGWWLRLSSAAVAEGLFRLLQMPVLREGTQLVVAGVPIHIEPACAGWNLLQLALFAGVAIGVHEIAPSRRFGFYLCLLPPLAWTANLVRIVALSGIALTFEVTMADGVLHGLSGLLAVLVVAAAARVLSSLIAPSAQATTRTISSAH